MDRRAFVTALFSILAAPLATEAQQVGKVPRLGVLFGSPAVSWIEALRQGLRELGYVEGQTVRIEWRSAEGRYERLRGLARQLDSLRGRVLVGDAAHAVH